MKSRDNRQSAITRFWHDQSGQGMLFAAASLVLLVGFVALVFNVGRLIERRTRIQLAADAAAYSGAVVEANSLSSIAWTNSAMAQLYYNGLKYAVDVCVTGVAAKMEMVQNQWTPGDPLPGAVSVHRDAWIRAEENLPRAKEWMVDLSRVENAVAILTPRLVQEEMFAVAKSAGAERLSVYPSFRMFPHAGGTISYLIEQFANGLHGWRMTSLAGQNSQSIFVYLQGDEWHIEYSQEGIVAQEVVIAEEEPDRWHIWYYQPPGNPVQEIILAKTDNVGWVVWGVTYLPGGDRTSIPEIRLEAVDMDGDDEKEGTRVTYQGRSHVFKRGPEGDLYVWDFDNEEYVNTTSSETVIEGVTVRVNVTNLIHFPGGTARIGDPTRVDIGKAHVVLSEPPRISTGFGPVRISVKGFEAGDFNVSVGGFSLQQNNADGRWRKHYDPREELWWRHRLTEQQPDVGVDRQWQYDHQTIGALLREEPNLERYAIDHALGDRLGPGPLPAWTQWFDPKTAAPRNPSFVHSEADFSEPDEETGIKQLLGEQPPEDVYYLTQECEVCGGTGYVLGKGGDGKEAKEECPACHARDHDPDIHGTEVRVFLADVFAPGDHAEVLCNGKAGLDEDDYLDARLHEAAYGLPRAGRPLVLAEEFFQYGINVGVWRSSDAPMLFPSERQPDWGYVAIASARLGVPDSDAPGEYKYHFSDSEDREEWCHNDPGNLYSADISARLYPSREQMKGYDLDLDILYGVPVGWEVGSPRESTVAYLWDAILSSSHVYPFESNNWLDQFEGRADAQVGRRLRNMRNRQGRRFDFQDVTLEDVVQH